jgi:glycosyltransferase involved in cell wall biosynthesis
MPKQKIIVHCLVKNEERFIWYALNSVLPFVDKVMAWDTGSTDNTVQIIKSIKSKKINLKILNSVDAIQHTKIRQQMLDQTPKGFNWLMILDGDEVWSKSQIKKIVGYLKTTKDKVVVVKIRNLVGDIYHQLSESAGQYQIGSYKGHLGLRFINLSLPGLKVINPHGGQTYTSNNTPLQELASGLKVLPNTYYFHATHLVRSSQDKSTLKRAFKKKYEIGQKITKKDLPKILFIKTPSLVPSVTQPMDTQTYFKSLLQTPIRKIKRTLFPSKSGY